MTIEKINTKISLDELTQEHINEMYKAYKNAKLPINKNETPQELDYIKGYLNLFGKVELELSNEKPEFKLVISKYIDKPSSNIFIQTYIKIPKNEYSKTHEQIYAYNLKHKFEK